MTVRAALALVATPEEGAVWVGPFEQLTGAAYSLMAAERHGIATRNRSDYHNNVRRPLVTRLVQYLDTGVTDAVVENSLAGFYFNSAKERLVWAGERLLRGFASVACPQCGKPPEYTGDWTNRGRMLAAAARTLAHAQQAHGLALPRTSETIGAHDEGKDFDWLGDDVNARKHSLYPDPAIKAAADRPEREQVEMARRAFCLLVDCYVELLVWAPTARRPDPRGRR